MGEGPTAGRPLETQWADYWLERARWHRFQGDPVEAWRCAERATAALPAQPSFRHLQLQILRAELLWDRGAIEQAAPILDELVTVAEADGHQPVMWLARAIRAAVQARAGHRPELLTPPPELVANNVNLALATLYWHGEAAKALGRTQEAAVMHDRGRTLARERGFADWLALFDRG